MADSFLKRYIHITARKPKPVGFSTGKTGMDYGIECHNVPFLLHSIPTRAIKSYTWKDIVELRASCALRADHSSSISTDSDASEVEEKAGGDWPLPKNMDDDDSIEDKCFVCLENQESLDYDDEDSDISMKSISREGDYDGGKSEGNAEEDEEYHFVLRHLDS